MTSRKTIVIAGVLAALVLVLTMILMNGSRSASAGRKLGFFGRILFRLNEDTRFAPGYSDKAFATVKLGDSETSVTNRLGPPISTRTNEPSTIWVYASGPVPGFASSGELATPVDFTAFVFDAEGRLKQAFGQKAGRSAGGGFTIMMGEGQNFLGLSAGHIEQLKGRNFQAIEAQYGRPQAVRESRAVRLLQYSDSPSSRNYRKRNIGIDAAGKVVEVDDGFYLD